jgi:hypothetical protein
MRTQVFAALLTLAHTGLASAQGSVNVTVDSARGEIVLSVGPMTVPGSLPYEHHGEERYHMIQWPVSGWMRGYRVDFRVNDVSRRDLVHHVGMANVDRRQVASPIAERVLAAAHETTPVSLPKRMGVPLSAGHRMVLYYALVNPDTTPVAGAVLEIRIPWADAGISTTLVPFYASSRPDTATTISFDIPAGRSETQAEFTVRTSGWLRAAGGHLHDHGVELRLEDVERGKVLARIRGKRAADGSIVAVGLEKFRFKRRGLRLLAGHRYRVVAVYDNPTGKAITSGAMGFIAGVFIPESVRALDVVDATDPLFARDVRGLLGGGRTVSAAHAHH